MQTLSELIKAGDAEGVRRMLDKNPEVLESESAEAPSWLLLALYYGQAGVADAIRQYRPKLTIFEASAMGDRHALDAILAQDPSAHAQVSSDGFTPLGYAAYFGHYEVLRALLDAGADPSVPSQNPMGVLPLHSALSSGHKEVARLLIDRGTDVNAASAEGWTPLHYAAHNGDIETAKYLLDHHAKREVLTREGKSPADLAEERGFSDLGELLRPVGA
ncbi:ankyrin repeat domain-containing protein [Fimbriimonas ginsengisoli]|uniref:Ankyrin n=1 Tax=Fimbriimonas ginsengisoli Gsoil 348 TaxID=661478 RepID=A0A068NNI0_FIMGI|nr:ankyrin repeat domain-containing protein [Fimbriimonas ginsengisoli]AIE84962.1 Ankyrin [Fimbriimonas ginsengisoli Gsoil 348]